LESRGGATAILKETDVTGALYNMCSSFNALRECMSTFAKNNVKNDQFMLLDEGTKEKFLSIKIQRSA
jgi:hypothetical protein